MHVYEGMCFQTRLVLVILVGIGMLFPFVTTVKAHGVYVYAWVDGGTVYTESYFGAKGKVKGGLIKVYDLSGKKLLQGKSNDQGEFSFKSPQKSDLRIVVEAGMGHRNEYVLKAEELLGTDEIQLEGPKSEDSVSDTHSVNEFGSAESEEIKKIVEQALDFHLRTIKQELAAIRHEKRVGMSDIIGGVGYIFGIMGVIMYIKSRKN